MSRGGADSICGSFGQGRITMVGELFLTTLDKIHFPNGASGPTFRARTRAFHATSCSDIQERQVRTGSSGRHIGLTIDVSQVYTSGRLLAIFRVRRSRHKIPDSVFGQTRVQNRRQVLMPHVRFTVTILSNADAHIWSLDRNPGPTACMYVFSLS